MSMAYFILFTDQVALEIIKYNINQVVSLTNANYLVALGFR